LVFICIESQTENRRMFLASARQAKKKRKTFVTFAKLHCATKNTSKHLSRKGTETLRSRNTNPTKYTNDAQLPHGCHGNVVEISKFLPYYRSLQYQMRALSRHLCLYACWRQCTLQVLPQGFVNKAIFFTYAFLDRSTRPSQSIENAAYKLPTQLAPVPTVHEVWARLFRKEIQNSCPSSFRAWRQDQRRHRAPFSKRSFPQRGRTPRSRAATIRQGGSLRECPRSPRQRRRDPR